MSVLLMYAVLYFYMLLFLTVDQASSVGIKTRYRLDGPGIEFR